jgi:hypothetical protein
VPGQLPSSRRIGEPFRALAPRPVSGYSPEQLAIDSAARPAIRLPPSGAGILAPGARSSPRRVHLPLRMAAQVLVLKLRRAIAVLAQGIG